MKKSNGNTLCWCERYTKTEKSEELVRHSEALLTLKLTISLHVPLLNKFRCFGTKLVHDNDAHKIFFSRQRRSNCSLLWAQKTLPNLRCHYRYNKISATCLYTFPDLENQIFLLKLHCVRISSNFILVHIIYSNQINNLCGNRNNSVYNKSNTVSMILWKWENIALNTYTGFLEVILHTRVEGHLVILVDKIM